MKPEMPATIDNRKYLQLVEIFVNCGKDMRKKHRDELSNRALSELMLRCARSLFSAGRHRRIRIKYFLDGSPERKRTITKILKVTWEITKVTSDFIRYTSQSSSCSFFAFRIRI